MGEEAEDDDMGDIGGVLDSSGGVHVTTLELAIISMRVWTSNGTGRRKELVGRRQAAHKESG